MNILSRDTGAMRGGNDTLRAIVLTYNGEYYGHIYVWTRNNVCVAIGIRSRVDMNILKHNGYGMKNILFTYLKELEY
jgi:hypothetical protein